MGIQYHFFPMSIQFSQCYLYLGCTEFHTIPAKLFYIIHCLRQGDALGFRQKHHEPSTHRCQDTCGTRRASLSRNTQPAAPRSGSLWKQPCSPTLTSPQQQQPLVMPTSSPVSLCHEFCTFLKFRAVPLPLYSWHTFIHSLIKQLFIGCLVCAMHSEKTSSPTSRGQSRPPERSSLSFLLPTLEGHCILPFSTLLPPCYTVRFVPILPKGHL